MQRLLSILIGALTIVVLLVLIVSVGATYFAVASPESESTISQQLSFLPSIALSAGVLVAILTFSRERTKQEQERHRQMSNVLLERCREGFDTTIELLSDQNNNRTTWVRAARTLLRVLELKKEITSPEYMVAYQLDQERARSELYNILTQRDEKTGERIPLPPQFFYGIADWRTSKILDEAAIKSASRTVVYEPTIDSVPPQPTLTYLAPESVVAIFDFIEYPSTYEDPLRTVEWWEGDWSGSMGIDQGARRYVAHKKQKTAVNGKLYDNKDSNVE